MFKLIILHKNNTDILCPNDGEEAKSVSLTKRYIFIKVNLNVFSVVIRFYRIYVTKLVFTFSFYKYKNHFEFPRVVRSPRLKFWKFLGGRGVIKDPLDRKILGVGRCKSKSLPWGVWIFSGTTHYIFLAIPVWKNLTMTIWTTTWVNLVQILQTRQSLHQVVDTNLNLIQQLNSLLKKFVQAVYLETTCFIV